MQLLSIIFLVCPLMIAQAQDEGGSLADDQSLVDEEFSFSQLFDQTYGILLGYGGPRYQLYVGASYFATDHLNILLSFGIFGEYQPEEEDNETRERNEKQASNEAETTAGSVQLRYYPHDKLPLSIFVGGGIAHWDGIAKTDDRDDTYRIWELYGESGVLIFYFWRGFYIESTIFGIAGGHILDLKSNADEDTKKNITKEIKELDQYGMLAGTWNFTIGYFF